MAEEKSKANGKAESEVKPIEVGKLYVIEKEGVLIGTDIQFSDNVKNIQGGMQILDLLRNSMNLSGWSFEMLMRLISRQSPTQPSVESATALQSGENKDGNDSDSKNDNSDTNPSPQ